MDILSKIEELTVLLGAEGYIGEISKINEAIASSSTSTEIYFRLRGELKLIAKKMKNSEEIKIKINETIAMINSITGS